MRLWLSSFLILLSITVIAQKITVSGRVVDRETKEPLPFASVGLKGKSIGTITNLDGEFDFHLAAELRNDFIVINMLGYKTFEAPVWSLHDLNPLVIELDKSTLYLKEVVISDSLTGGDILQIALSRIEINYPMKSFMVEGFYRDLKKVDGTYISLLEAAVKIADDDYSEPRTKNKLRERVGLREVRRSIGYANRYTDYFDHDNLLEVLLLHNTVRYRQFPLEVSFYENLIRKKDTYYNGEEIYVIQHKETPEFKFTAYVEKSSYAIIHLEYTEMVEAELNRKRDLTSKLSSSQWINDFKRFNGKYYPNYISLNTKVNWYSVETNELEFETELYQSLLINEVTENPTEQIKSQEKMRRYGLQFQFPPYNKTFWDQYNVIKERPLDKKIISDLEKQGPLEKQFNDY